MNKHNNTTKEASSQSTTRRGRKWIPTQNQKGILLPFGIDLDGPYDAWAVMFGEQAGMTTAQIVEHLGLLDAVVNDSEYYEVLTQRPDEWERRILSAEAELERETLGPLRRHIEKKFNLSLYRTPPTKYQPTNDGKVAIVIQQDEEGKPKEAKLKLYPLTVEDGKKYGLDQNSLKLIAKDVIYILLQRRAAHGTLREKRILLAYIDGWTKIIDNLLVKKWIIDTLGEKTPSLIDTKVKQLLLLPPEEPKE